MFKLTVLINHKEAEFYFRTYKLAQSFISLNEFKAYTLLKEAGQ